ncbi:MAG: hypothetical protein GTN78_20350, partial [Gemmatimonadales bacterium]|nr:hypothetical protein [Gemmatimonadales bacterium]
RRYRWTQEEGRTEEIVLPPQLTEGFDRILLVAGEVHSGNTMRTFVRFLRDQGAHEIRTYALQKSVAPTFAPDYWSLQTDRDL